MATRTINNSQDIIDSRDIIARLEVLKSDRADYEMEVAKAQEALSKSEFEVSEATVGMTVADLIDTDLVDELEARRAALQDAENALAGWDEEDGDELKALEALNEEGEQNASDWEGGAPLIRESYFTEFCEQDVSDLGYLPEKAPWWLVIDWEATANNLKADYSEVTFDGETYLVRS